MAVRYYGVDVGGQDAPDVTIDTSTTSSDVELAVDDTNLTAGSITKRQFVRMALKAIEQALASIDGVSDVEKEQEYADDDGGFILTFDDEKRGKEGIHSAIKDKGWGLVEMRPIEASLEDIFIKLVTKDEK